MPIEIVVDAMGSDKAPESEIRGAILASRTLTGVNITLVGPEETLTPALQSALESTRRNPLLTWPPRNISIVHASEWITMDDKAAQAVRSKRDSTMRVGLKMVREGSAQGFFTAGNTGAAMATAKMVLGGLSGVDRPALATILPTSHRQPHAAARRRRQRRLRPRKSRPVRRDGQHVRPQRAQDPQPPRRPALDRRRRLQGQLAHPRHAAPAARAQGPQLHRQRRRPRPLQRRRRRRRLRRLRRQRRAQDHAKASPSWSASPCASRSSRPSPRRSARCSPATPSTPSRSASTTPSTAAPRCWACAASAS